MPSEYDVICPRPGCRTVLCTRWHRQTMWGKCVGCGSFIEGDDNGGYRLTRPVENTVGPTPK